MWVTSSVGAFGHRAGRERLECELERELLDLGELADADADLR